MPHNLATCSKEECCKANVDLAAPGVAYKKRLNMTVVAIEVENQQPEQYREYFRNLLQYYRDASKQFHRSNDPVYAKKEDRK